NPERAASGWRARGHAAHDRQAEGDEIVRLHQLVDTFGRILFGNRRVFLGVFILITVLLGASATRLQVDAGFEKMIPLEHEYMQTFIEYRNTFGGANRVLVALRKHEGDIYDARFFDTLKAVTDEVFFIPGVDRAT